MKNLLLLGLFVLLAGCGSSNSNSGGGDGNSNQKFSCGSATCESAKQFCRQEQTTDRATNKARITSSGCRDLASCKDCDCLSDKELNTTNGNGSVSCQQDNSVFTLTRIN